MALSLLLTGCDPGLNDDGGDPVINTGDNSDTDSDNVDALTHENVTSPRALPAEYTNRKVISYSGYREGQSPDTGVYPTSAQIQEDLEILESMGFTLIRIYDTSQHAETVLDVIKTNNLDIKVMQGVWIAGATEEQDVVNLQNLDQAVTWATGDYSDIIISISVGNETMVDWNSFGWATPAEHIAGYVTYIRNKVTQPVTVDDNWEPWSMEDESGTVGPYGDVNMVLEAVDFVTIHTYAIFDAEYGMWDYRLSHIEEADRGNYDLADLMMDAAIDYTKTNYLAVKDNMTSLGIDKPIIIGETGWQDSGDATGIGHEVNMAMYYEKMNAWISEDNSPSACVFFEAFDEPWKQTDDHWGFFNVDREAKYIVYSSAEWSGLGFTQASNYTASDAVSKDPISEGDTITDSTVFVFAEDPATLATGYDLQYLEDLTPNSSWEAWMDSSPTANAAYYQPGTEDPDESETWDDHYNSITPSPAIWGWGMMRLLSVGADLSNFSNGYLVFDISTEYSGNIEVGFFTGHGTDNDVMELMVSIDPSNNSYGYSNDGNWHTVTIPVTDLIAAAEPGYEMPTTPVNMAKVYTPFVISDRVSGFDTAPINVDIIHFTQN